MAASSNMFCFFPIILIRPSPIRFCWPSLRAINPGSWWRPACAYWATEAQKRGWVIVSPSAPDGESFYTGAESELPNLLDEVAKLVRFEGGKAHLAGISNGGLSAYRAATEYPARFLSLTVLPGIPPDDRAFHALQRLRGIPVAAFAGAEDSSWVRGSRDAKAEMDRLGIQNTLQIVLGEGHVIGLDPAKLFDLLDQRRPHHAGADLR
jgi:pimeloyl-ACP methyl ester carboxylesterase